MDRAHIGTEPKYGVGPFLVHQLDPPIYVNCKFSHFSIAAHNSFWDPITSTAVYWRDCNNGRSWPPPNVPEFPPLPLPDKHNANNNSVPLFFHQYIIEGVQDLPQELHSHVTTFYEKLMTLMDGASESWQLITKKNIQQYWLQWSICIPESLSNCWGQFTRTNI